jgi:hypothetical protein
MTATVTTYRPSVDILDIVGGAWRNLRVRAPELWPLLLPWSAVFILSSVLGHAAKASGQDNPFAAIKLAQTLVGAFIGAVLSGVTLRVLLGEGRAAWRPDRELGAFVALTMLIQLATTFAMDLPPIIHPSKAQALERLGDSIVAGTWSLWLIARLALWPIAQLMGERRASAYDSLRRMKGAVWTFWIATLLAAAPLFILAFALDWSYLRHGQVAGLLVSAPVMGCAGLAITAVTAELFRARWLRD